MEYEKDTLARVTVNYALHGLRQKTIEEKVDLEMNYLIH